MDLSSYTTITNAFQSARLRYVRVDESDQRVRDFIPQVVQDPVIQAMASSNILQPQGKKNYDSYLQSVVNAFLGVAICLLPEEATALDQQVNSDTSTRNEEEPIIIGIMCMGWGGISASVLHHRNASIGISLATRYQNRGYGREAINWMLDWGFIHAGLHSISIDTASYNPRGVHLYESIGFKLEGRRREIIWQNREWHDLLVFGITEQEWEQIRKPRKEVV